MDDRLIYQQVKLNHFYVILKKASAIFASRLLGLPVLAGSTISHGCHASTHNQYNLSSFNSTLRMADG